MKKQLKEGPIPPADSADSVRPIRGLVAATNDTRPGIPAPTSRQPVTHTYASKGTTSSDGNANIQNLNPEQPTASPTQDPASIGSTGSPGSSTVKLTSQDPLALARLRSLRQR